MVVATPHLLFRRAGGPVNPHGTMSLITRFGDSMSNFFSLFLTMSHPVLHTTVLCIVAALALFAGSRLSRKGSMHRMFWAVVPPLTVVSLGTGPGIWNPRQWALVLAVWVWGVRHALNLWFRQESLHLPDWLLQRPGGAASGTPGPHWLVSLFCFHLYPAALLTLLCLPMYYAMSVEACTGLERASLRPLCVCTLALAHPPPPRLRRAQPDVGGCAGHCHPRRGRVAGGCGGPGALRLPLGRGAE